MWTSSKASRKSSFSRTYWARRVGVRACPGTRWVRSGATETMKPPRPGRMTLAPVAEKVEPPTSVRLCQAAWLRAPEMSWGTFCIGSAATGG